MSIHIHTALSSEKVIVTGGDFIGNSNCLMWFETKVQKQGLIVPTLKIHELGIEGNISFEIEGMATTVLWGNKIYYQQVSECLAETPEKMIAEITNKVITDAYKRIRFNVTSNLVSCHVRMPCHLTLHNMDAIPWNTTGGNLERFFKLRIPNRRIVPQMFRPEE